MDEETKPKRADYTLGADTSSFSVDELRETAGRLREEADRLDAEANAKQKTLAAASALFRT